MVAMSVVLIQTASATAGSAATVECGQLTAYTAPDPVAPTPGTLGIGVLPPWEVLPTATISAAAATALPSIVNSSPTCVSLEFDAEGKVASVDFASDGESTGTVDYDATSGFYLFADRLLVPTFITDAYPGLAALFVASYQAGTPLSVTFTVDVMTGAFTGFDGRAEFCGRAGLTNSGDGKVGEARIPAEVLGARDIRALEDANGEVCAAVHAVGVIDANAEGGISVETDVVITEAAPAASPPDTSTLGMTGPGEQGKLPAVPVIVALALGFLAATARPSRVRPAAR